MRSNNPFDDNDDIKQDENFIIKVFGQKDDGGSGSGTKQLPKDVFADSEKEGESLPPLYDPQVWGFLLEQNTRLKKLVAAMAANTVGLGWEVVPRKEEESFEDENAEEIKREREAFAELFDDINPEMPFNELMAQVKTDEEATGQGYLEVVRNERTSSAGAEFGTEVRELWHLPSHTMRVAKPTMGRMRYVQMKINDPTEKVYFKEFGEKAELSASTGKWEDEEGVEVESDDRANEVIQFKLYTPRSSFYGIPRAVSAAPAIAGTRLAHRRNVAFFENDATPRMAIIVNGGELSEDSIGMIQDFAESRGKGPGNNGRVMLLQGRGADKMLGDAENVKINVMPLTVGVTDDASFARYLQMNNEEVREAFGIGQIFIGTSDDVNRAVALAMKQLTVEQVFEPESRRYEFRIDRCVMRTNGAKVTKLKFTRPRTTDLVAEAQAFAMLAGGGGVTPNQMREFQNKPKFNAAWGDTPLAILKAGLLEDKDNELETLVSKYGLESLNAQDSKRQQDMQEKQVDASIQASQSRAGSPKLDYSDFEEAFGEHAAMNWDYVHTFAHKLREMGFEVDISPPVGLLDTAESEL